MSWATERDALIAQTKAFIESVTNKAGGPGRFEAAPARSDPVAPPVERPSTTPSLAAPLKPQATLAPALTKPAVPADSVLHSRRFDHVSMSAEIRARIATFRAHQERFNRERHDYFNATLARLRAEINELPPRMRGDLGAAKPAPQSADAPASTRLPAEPPSSRNRRSGD